MLSGKVSRFSITFTLGISPDSAPYPISGVLQGRHQPKLEAVFRILPLICCVPTIITSSLFIGFEHMSDEWKREKVNYEFGITSFLRSECLGGQKCRFPRWFGLSAQTYRSWADV
jgi:hypothetical protein